MPVIGTPAFNAVAILNTAPTSADIARLVTFFGKRWNISV